MMKRIAPIVCRIWNTVGGRFVKEKINVEIRKGIFKISPISIEGEIFFGEVMEPWINSRQVAAKVGIAGWNLVIKIEAVADDV